VDGAHSRSDPARHRATRGRVLLATFVAFWWSMFSDQQNNPYPRRLSRPTWILAFLALNVFGALLYYLYEYRARVDADAASFPNVEGQTYYVMIDPAIDRATWSLSQLRGTC
jgi:hypothetical protein